MKHPVSVAVVLPCYKVTQHILGVLSRIGPEVSTIYVVDDCCPDGSGQFVLDHNKDSRVKVVFHGVNQGVGGATMSGYSAAMADGHDVLVKVDGDGQMAPELIPFFIAPIVEGVADYTKGNRFYDLTHIGQMPGLRIFGNAVLSFISKFSTGYWDVFDPTNGYTAIHARVAAHLPFEKISRRYFFESDILFRLNTVRAVVMDIPMDSHYADEVSGLKVRSIVGEFLGKHVKNFSKRIFYNYFLRDMSAASLNLVFGILLIVFGLVFGGYQWGVSMTSHVFASPGTVMLAALPLIMGFQFLLAFLMHDSQAMPRAAIHRRIYDGRTPKTSSLESISHSDDA